MQNPCFSLRRGTLTCLVLIEGENRTSLSSTTIPENAIFITRRGFEPRRFGRYGYWLSGLSLSASDTKYFNAASLASVLCALYITWVRDKRVCSARYWEGKHPDTEAFGLLGFAIFIFPDSSSKIGIYRINWRVLVFTALPNLRKPHPHFYYRIHVYT